MAWLLTRPGVSNVVVGARHGAQVEDNLAAATLSLSAAHIAPLDAVSRVHPIYPYGHQMDVDERNPKPTPW